MSTSPSSHSTHSSSLQCKFEIPIAETPQVTNYTKSLDIGTIAWTAYVEDFGLSYAQLNDTWAGNCIGLAVGCILFTPLALKYGRRPVYVLSTVVTFAMTVCSAKLNTFGEIMAVQVISGLSAAVSETLVQMTVSPAALGLFSTGDLLTDHAKGCRRLFCTSTGHHERRLSHFHQYRGKLLSRKSKRISSDQGRQAFLGPVAAGYIVTAEGWRWQYWWTAIFLAVSVVLVIFFYEETKFTSPTNNVSSTVTEVPSTIEEEKAQASLNQQSGGVPTAASHQLNHSIPMKSYRQRMALHTTTPSSFKLLLRHVYQPFVMLFTIPAVAFTALQYGCTIAWYSVLATTQAEWSSTRPTTFRRSASAS
jgi:MFS family permease